MLRVLLANWNGAHAFFLFKMRLPDGDHGGVGQVGFVQHLDTRRVAAQLGHQRVFAGKWDTRVDHLDNDVHLGHHFSDFFAGLVHMAGEPVDRHVVLRT